MQLQVPAQDPHKRRPITITSHMGKGFMRPHPLPRNYGPLSTGAVTVFGGMAAGKLSTSFTHLHISSHN